MADPQSRNQVRLLAGVLGSEDLADQEHRRLFGQRRAEEKRWIADGERRDLAFAKEMLEDAGFVVRRRGDGETRGHGESPRLPGAASPSPPLVLTLREWVEFLRRHRDEVRLLLLDLLVEDFVLRLPERDPGQEG